MFHARGVRRVRPALEARVAVARAADDAAGDRGEQHGAARGQHEYGQKPVSATALARPSRVLEPFLELVDRERGDVEVLATAGDTQLAPLESSSSATSTSQRPK